MSEPGDFLTRWSRRKLAPEAKPAAPATAAPEPEAPAAPAEPTALPELPPVETLTAASDFKPFLQPGVPASLRVAALRRLWAIDPEIRDFIGPARDYGWDWNAPGGVPGGGPAPSPEDIARVIDRLFGPAEPPAAAEETVPPRELQAAPRPSLAAPAAPPPEPVKPDPPAAPVRRHGKATPV